MPDGQKTLAKKIYLTYERYRSKTSPTGVDLNFVRDYLTITDVYILLDILDSSLTNPPLLESFRLPRSFSHYTPSELQTAIERFRQLSITQYTIFRARRAVNRQEEELLANQPVPPVQPDLYAAPITGGSRLSRTPPRTRATSSLTPIPPSLVLSQIDSSSEEPKSEEAEHHQSIDHSPSIAEETSQEVSIKQEAHPSSDEEDPQQANPADEDDETTFHSLGGAEPHSTELVHYRDPFSSERDHSATPETPLRHRRLLPPPPACSPPAAPASVDVLTDPEFADYSTLTDAPEEVVPEQDPVSTVGLRRGYGLFEPLNWDDPADQDLPDVPKLEPVVQPPPVQHLLTFRPYIASTDVFRLPIDIDSRPRDYSSDSSSSSSDSSDSSKSAGKSPSINGRRNTASLTPRTPTPPPPPEDPPNNDPDPENPGPDIMPTTFPAKWNLKAIYKFKGEDGSELRSLDSSFKSLCIAQGLPVYQGGTVTGDEDHSYTAVEAATPGSKANYTYGKRVMADLMNTFPAGSNAHRWFVTYMESDKPAPNSSQATQVSLTVQEISLYDLLATEYNPDNDVATAYAELTRLRWDPFGVPTTTVETFRSQLNSLFTRAEINSWPVKRRHIIEAVPD
ncbi:hypothetical protein BJ508DRAFT_336631 [Ascobolus immersus RN42]|uniref:Uncharacterized protein n=1 Tax=Ascobolus immersus RN42 TaxID=1160509 RepID=A0A3N4HFI1_ASCIM|nr:hypothetical protein BJ508DRAFT_336631 [Ascobolus immersus RN42]